MLLCTTFNNLEEDSRADSTPTQIPSQTKSTQTNNTLVDSSSLSFTKSSKIN